MTIQQAQALREKLADRQDRLAKAFDEAKATADDGSTTYDLSKVTQFGKNLSAQAVADKIQQSNAELDDLAKQVESMEAVEKAAGNLDRPAAGGMTHPGGDGGGAAGKAKRYGSLGEEIVQSKRYSEWAKSGANGGLSFRFDDMMPSDALAKGGGETNLRMKTLFETGAGWSPESTRLPGFVEATTRPVQLLDIVPMAQTGQDQIVYMEETTRTHNAGEIGEGATFPESQFALTEQTSPVRKVATSIPVTDEQLEDVAQAEGFLNNRLTFGLRQRLDAQVLVGNGTAPNLTGIKNTAGIQSQAKGTDNVPDAIHKLLTKIRLNGRAQPTHTVMHPNDWQALRLLRDSNGAYLWGPPSDQGEPRIWGLPIVLNDADAAGTAYAGAFTSEWGALYERRGVDVQVGFVGTQFAEGKRTMRADMRAAFVIFRPSAFGEITGI